MKPEDQLLLLCLRQDFTPQHIEAVKTLASNASLDWERIALAADQHGVSALIFRNLNQCPVAALNIPEPAIHKFKLSVYKSNVIKERQTERLCKALAFLQEQGLPAMLIKGSALDCDVYQNPEDAVSDDIDLIIRARREALTKEEIHKFNVFFHRQGIEFEFFGHHDLDINGLIPIDFESIWDQAEPGDYHGYPVLLMSAEDLLLSLCINSSRKRYFRLKSIFSINETVQRKQNISWTRLASRARAFHCEYIVYTALLVTSNTTGSNLPGGWEALFDLNPIRQKLIQTAVNLLAHRVAFYPSPYSGITFLGRPVQLSLILPYIGYSPTQIAKKLSYAVRVRSI